MKIKQKNDIKNISLNSLNLENPSTVHPQSSEPR